VLLLPALGLYFSISQKPGFLKQPDFYRRVIGAVLLSLVPLLLYLYLPLRGHIGSLDGAYQNSWAGFWQQVSAGGYGVFIFGNPFGQERDIGFYWTLFTSQFYTLVPGFLGVIYLAWRGQYRYLLLTGVAFLTYVGFNLFYQVSDIEVFFIPPFLIWAAWSGVGFVAALNVITLNVKTLNVITFKIIAVGVILLLFGAIVIQPVRLAWPTLTSRNNWQVHDYGLDMLQQPLPQNSTIVGLVGEMTLLRYFQQTEQLRPDVETVAADKEPERLAAVEKLLTEGKTVYLTRELPGAAEHWSLSAEGPLIRVNPQPVTTPPLMDKVINQPVTLQITLLGYTLSHPPHTGGSLPPLRLTVYWQATAPLTTSLKVSARLIDPTGQAAAAADAAPVHFAYPTTAWRPGEVVVDVYDLTAPAVGQYIPLLIWYDPAQGNAEVGRIGLESVIIP
jgi:hypothetical protein